MSAAQLIAVPISTLVPFIAYYVIYRLFAEPGTSIRVVGLCVLWGAVARFLFFLAVVIAAIPDASVQLAAPVVGEILKAVFLFYLFSRRRITGSLGGALYGAAVGLGLSVEFALEVILLPGALFGQSVLETTIVLLSNNTVRAITGAMIGFGMGMAYIERETSRRRLMMLGGLLAAIIFGISYSRLGSAIQGLIVVYALVYSISGVGLMLAAERTASLHQAFQQIKEEKKRSDALLHGVVPLGVALSSERDFDRLLETLLSQAISFCNADGGTLYLRTSAGQLEFVIARNETLGLRMGGASGDEVTFGPLPLYDEAGQPNLKNVATYVVHEGQSMNIRDVYEETAFQFPGPLMFDKGEEYRSRSMLCVPLKSESGQVIGVLQFVNARSGLTGEAIPFDTGTQEVIESLSALAAAALTSYIRTENLRAKAQEYSVAVHADDRARQVVEITESEFFKELQSKLGEIKDRRARRAAAHK